MSRFSTSSTLQEPAVEQGRLERDRDSGSESKDRAYKSLDSDVTATDSPEEDDEFAELHRGTDSLLLSTPRTSSRLLRGRLIEAVQSQRPSRRSWASMVLRMKSLTQFLLVSPGTIEAATTEEQPLTAAAREEGMSAAAISIFRPLLRTELQLEADAAESRESSSPSSPSDDNPLALVSAVTLDANSIAERTAFTDSSNETRVASRNEETMFTTVSSDVS